MNQTQKYYDYNLVKSAIGCEQFINRFFPESRKGPNRRYQAVWRGGTGFNVEISPDGKQWHDFKTGEGGGVLELCAVSKCGGRDNIPGAAGFLGANLGLPPSRGPAQTKLDGKRLAAVYRYRDKDGKLMSLKLRYEPKDFRQRFARVPDPDPAFPDDERQWAFSKKEAYSGYRDTLYREDEIFHADSGITVYLCEGEKDADNLRSLGYLASCFKCDKVVKDFSILSGREVILIPDRDEAGEKYLLEALHNLRQCRVKALVKRIPPEGLPENADLSDWLDAQDSAESAEELRLRFESLEVTAVPDTSPDMRLVTSAENGRKGGRPKTKKEGGNDKKDPPETIARQFMELYPGRFKNYLDTWYEFNGVYYDELRDSDFSAIVQTAFDLLPNTGPQTVTLNRNVIRNLEKNSLCKIPAVKAGGATLDGNFTLSGRRALDYHPLVLRNVVINAEEVARAMYAGRPLPENIVNNGDIFVKNCFGYDFDPEAQCPEFQKTLDLILPDPEDQTMLQMMFGYCLVPTTRHNCCFVLCGNGGTGKSTVIRVLQNLVNNDCTAAPVTGVNDRFTMEDITKKLLWTIEDDSDHGDNSLARIEGTIKEITDGAVKRVDIKNKQPYNARAKARLVMACNQLPLFTDTSDGLWRRIVLFNFDRAVPEAERRDSEYMSRIFKREMPGIFNWALRGLGRDLTEYPGRGTFPAAEKSLLALEKWRKECDRPRLFLEDHYESCPGLSVKCQTLYNHYREWSNACGLCPVGAPRFKEAVKRAFANAVEKRVNNVRWWYNITPVTVI